MQYRHEAKHLITAADVLVLRQRLRVVARPDAHAPDGVYHIRSLYFDTPRDTALREKLDGVSRREKFRIRCYNRSADFIRLEKKVKNGGLGYKQSARLTAAETQALLAGQTDWMTDDARPLVWELHAKMRTRLLAPKTLVDYLREPFVYAPGNVRVTIDRALRTGLRCTDLLDPDCVTVPAGDGGAVLEVKWDEFLPDVIRRAVQLPGCRTSAFSKYAACRVFD